MKPITTIASSSFVTYIASTPEEREACDRYDRGEKPSYSTGICGSLTVGYGKLDDIGYWEFPLPVKHPAFDVVKHLRIVTAIHAADHVEIIGLGAIGKGDVTATVFMDAKDDSPFMHISGTYSGDKWRRHRIYKSALNNAIIAGNVATFLDDKGNEVSMRFSKFVSLEI